MEYVNRHGRVVWRLNFSKKFLIGFKKFDDLTVLNLGWVSVNYDIK